MERREAEPAQTWRCRRSHWCWYVLDTRLFDCNCLLRVVNVGLLSWASYALYTKPHLRRDTKLLASAAAAALTLLGAEGYAAEKYRETPAGQEEERRAKKEGAVLYRTAKEHLLRPGVLGGLVGVCE